MDKWIRVATKIAIENSEDDKGFCLAAVLVRGGSLISCGVNKKKTDPIIARLAVHHSSRREGKYRRWMHAELDCINRIPFEKTKGSVLYVVRVTKNLLLANAEPCSMCKKELLLAGIRKIYYTIAPDNEGILYLNKMIDITGIDRERGKYNENSYHKRDVYNSTQLPTVLCD